MTDIINLHDDFPVELFADRFYGIGRGDERLKFISETFGKVVGAIYLPTRFSKTENFQKRALEYVRLFLSSKDSRLFFGNTEVFLSLEGLDSFQSADEVEKLFGKIKFFSLTWARENAFAYGVGERGESGKGGLKEEGRKLAEAVKARGGYIDVSHLNDKGAKELIDLKCNIFASHSNSREEFYSKRNLTPCVIRKIADLGGVIGLNGYKGFIGKRASIEKFSSHIESILDIGGEDVVALGLDICGNLLGDNSDCDLFKGQGDLEKLRIHLEKEGFSESLIDKLFFGNANKFLERLP